MDDKQKMNGLFIAGFVLAVISVALAGGAAYVGYYMNKYELAVIMGGAGALLAFVGIILAYYSKPKAKNSEMIIDNPENDVI